MADARWTPLLVEDRLVEAADVMRRLPEVRVPGHFNTWPKILHEFADLVGQEPPRLKRPPPSSDAISRMEQALTWLSWLEPMDRKLVWMRASGERWKTVCWTVGLARTAAHQHWVYALCLIASRLNGDAPARRSRQHVIELARAAKI